jgi:hypothetical protein
MKNKPAICFLALLAFSLVTATCQENPRPRASESSNPKRGYDSFRSNVAEIVKLSQSGFGDNMVKAYITNSPSHFQLSQNDIDALKSAGVSNEVIAAMINHDRVGDQRAPMAAQSTVPTTIHVPTPTATNSLAWSSTDSSPVGTPQNPLLEPALPPPAPKFGVKVVDQAPPAALAELIPVAPGANYYWTPGYWTWKGTWVWVRGSWIIRPWPGAIWVAGHWGRHGRGVIWIGGRWR